MHGVQWQSQDRRAGFQTSQVRPLAGCFKPIRMENAMLVIDRKRLEKIRIGDNVTLVVRRIKSGSVSIGIEAPADVVIWRDEIKRLRDEQRKDGGQ